jgi:hypothetical protein
VAPRACVRLASRHPRKSALSQAIGAPRRTVRTRRRPKSATTKASAWTSFERVVCCCTRSPQTSRRSPAGDRTVDAGRSPSVTGRAGLSRPVRLGRRRRDVGAAIERQGSQRWIVFTDPSAKGDDSPTRTAVRTGARDLAGSGMQRCRLPCDQPNAGTGAPTRASWQTSAADAASPCRWTETRAAKNDETAVAPQHDGGPWPRTRSPGPWRVSPDPSRSETARSSVAPRRRTVDGQRSPAAWAASTAGRRTRIRISAKPTMKPVRRVMARRPREARFMPL